VEERMNQYGVEFPFAVTGDILRSADIALGNLECPLSTRGEPIDKRFLFRAHPRNLAALSGAGIDIVSVANNHLLDFGEEAMRDTLEGLEDSGISYIGAGLSAEEAHRPVIMEVRGVKIAFLAYAAIRWKGSSEVPTETRVAFAEVDRVWEDVRRAKEQADLVVVIMHLGTEYQSQPNAEQLAVSQAAVEAGADLVIGHHPHVVQETASYLRGFIAYSLGDFVFDMLWEEEGAILRAFLTARGLERAEVIPVEIVDGVQPRPLLGEEGAPVVYTVK
jgi:poly-gamma-glutamate synthesis protein (capsule biosynthesis protein)